jgi:hypothetical protein
MKTVVDVDLAAPGQEISLHIELEYSRKINYFKLGAIYYVNGSGQTEITEGDPVFFSVDKNEIGKDFNRDFPFTIPYVYDGDSLLTGSSIEFYGEASYASGNDVKAYRYSNFGVSVIQ